MSASLGALSLSSTVRDFELDDKLKQSRGREYFRNTILDNILKAEIGLFVSI